MKAFSVAGPVPRGDAAPGTPPAPGVAELREAARRLALLRCRLRASASRSLREWEVERAMERVGVSYYERRNGPPPATPGA